VLRAELRLFVGVRNCLLLIVVVGQMYVDIAILGCIGSLLVVGYCVTLTIVEDWMYADAATQVVFRPSSVVLW
jgi:hypothetical protein